MTSRDPLDTRAPRETLAPAQDDVDEAVAAFSPLARELGRMGPGMLMVCSGVACFAGTCLGLAVDSAVPMFGATGAALAGTGFATVNALKRLLRHSRGEPRPGDHSVVALLFLVAAGIVCSLSMGLWLVVLVFGHAAD